LTIGYRRHLERRPANRVALLERLRDEDETARDHVADAALCSKAHGDAGEPADGKYAADVDL